MNKQERYILRCMLDKQYKALSECYRKPSIYKQQAFINCLEYVRSLGDVLCYGVTGYNCNFFTFAAVYTDNRGKWFMYYDTGRKSKIISFGSMVEMYKAVN